MDLETLNNIKQTREIHKTDLEQNQNVCRLKTPLHQIFINYSETKRNTYCTNQIKKLKQLTYREILATKEVKVEGEAGNKYL